MRVMSCVLTMLLLVGCGATVPDRRPKLTLKWTAVTGAESYIIERAEGSTFREIGRVPAPRTEYVDQAVRAGVEYCYQVRAWNRQGASSPTTQQCGAPKP
jgi:hypothetical protein